MKLGIAFAGGGVRGAAHLGVLQALEEHGIVPSLYAGTSAGSIVAAMKALGHSNEECLKMIQQADRGLVDVAYWDILKSMPTKFKNLPSILKGDELKKFLGKHLGDTFLLNATKDVAIISTDINTGSQIIFSSKDIPKHAVKRMDDLVKVYNRYTPLSLPHIVYSSCALPGIFRPTAFNQMTLVDGSLTNNLPANVLKAMGADKIIAIDLSKRNPNTREVTGIYDVIGQSVSILVGQNTYLSTSRTKDAYHLNPDLTGISMLEFDRAVECYEIGYAYGRKVAPILARELESP